MTDLGLIQRSARFSPCGTYRYTLGRIWDVARPIAAGIGLNPSKASGQQDDQTTSQMVNRFARLGFGTWRAANLHAAVGRDPKCLAGMAEPVGPDNDAAILEVLEGADLKLVFWGRGGALNDRAAQVLTMLEGHELWCLGFNADGSPRFPRAVPIERPLERYRNGGAA